MRSIHAAKLGVLCLLALSLPSPALQAQDTFLGLSGFTSTSHNPLEVLRQRLTQSNAGSVPLPLEGALDPEAYRIGPGDLFTIAIGGLETVTVPTPVTADGYLLLPMARSLPVAGLTLAEARRQALAMLRQTYSNVPVEVTLTQPRQFYVHVSGAVPLPGRYLALPVSRVSDILNLAYADTVRTPVANFDFRPSLRNVTVERRDGTVLSPDLARYFATGATAHNPYLSDGDVIVVPAYAPAYASVYVDGAVAFPGAYDHRPGDTALDLLALATGDDALAGLARARLTRTAADGTVETLDLDLDALRTAPEAAPVLQPRDHLSVPRATLPGGTAKVEGMVFNPGTYPISQGQTTLGNLLDRAGGLRPEAFLRGAYLERLALPAPEARLLQNNRFEPGTGRPMLVRPDTLEILQRLRLADLDFMSRAYFTQELRMQNRVSINLEAALADGAAPIVLRDGDRLVVPRDEGAVFVFGQVLQPGYVTHQPGQQAQYYIDAAGGSGPLATIAYVLKAGTGQYVPAYETDIRSGDMVFLDRRADIADTPEMQRLVLEEGRVRADARIRTSQVILQSVGTLASLVALIISIRRN